MMALVCGDAYEPLRQRTASYERGADVVGQDVADHRSRMCLDLRRYCYDLKIVDPQGPADAFPTLSCSVPKVCGEYKRF